VDSWYRCYSCGKFWAAIQCLQEICEINPAKNISQKTLDMLLSDMIYDIIIRYATI
jgi:hypothetical protein